MAKELCIFMNPDPILGRVKERFLFWLECVLISPKNNIVFKHFIGQASLNRSSERKETDPDPLPKNLSSALGIRVPCPQPLRQGLKH